MTHVNYINHLTVIKKSLMLKAGLLNPDKDGAQDYDLMLRVTDLSPKIAHVPKVLYHWRRTQKTQRPKIFHQRKTLRMLGGSHWKNISNVRACLSKPSLKRIARVFMN